MDSKQYIEEAMKTSSLVSQYKDATPYSKAKLQREIRINAGLGLAGETGEVADLVKKYQGQGHEWNHEKVLDEAGDVCWYLAELCFVEGYTFEKLWARNIEKLRKRYGEEFSSDKSINRSN